MLSNVFICVYGRIQCVDIEVKKTLRKFNVNDQNSFDISLERKFGIVVSRLKLDHCHITTLLILLTTSVFLLS